MQTLIKFFKKIYRKFKHEHNFVQYKKFRYDNRTFTIYKCTKCGEKITYSSPFSYKL